MIDVWGKEKSEDKLVKPVLYNTFINSYLSNFSQGHFKGTVD